MDQDKTGEHLILDVRQPQKYQAGHIPGAMLIPLGELEARQGELDRSKTIITYCRSGHRSMAAAIVLCGLGFEGVQHLDGDILSWPYETIAGIPEARPELISERADVRDILVLAMKLEKGSRDFYTAAGLLVCLLNIDFDFAAFLLHSQKFVSGSLTPSWHVQFYPFIVSYHLQNLTQLKLFNPFRSFDNGHGTV